MCLCRRKPECPTHPWGEHGSSTQRGPRLGGDPVILSMRDDSSNHCSSAPPTCFQLSYFLCHLPEHIVDTNKTSAQTSTGSALVSMHATVVQTSKIFSNRVGICSYVQSLKPSLISFVSNGPDIQVII